MNQEISFSSVQLSDALRTSCRKGNHFVCYRISQESFQYFSSRICTKTEQNQQDFLSTTSAIDLSDSICLYRGGEKTSIEPQYR